ncbi:MAG TPA: fatty acid desaturase [Steroidobacteraceae bacterium]|nr:fatty acid desaturase [Steroidobacteraceae bacterium]
MASSAAAANETVAVRGERIAAVEWPTLALIFAVYGGWLAATLAYRHWPLVLVAPVVVLLLVLHSSLQHEILHGHPTRKPWINRLLAIVPLSLWLPYLVYRQTHLAHHRDEWLTDPLDDPESYYLTPEDWARSGLLTRLALRAQQTLAGRMLLGSIWSIGAFWRSEIRLLIRGDAQRRRIWAEHLAWCVAVVAWLKLACAMPFWVYVIAMAIPANGILLVRSFAEHRARPRVRERIAIVEGSWILGPLFLFNNLHALHHEAPTIPWYRYNRRYRRERARLLAENGGLLYFTYFDVARRFLFRAHDAVPHPQGRVPAGTGP